MVSEPLELQQSIQTPDVGKGRIASLMRLVKSGYKVIDLMVAKK